MDKGSLASRVLVYFRRVDQLVFADGPTSNPSLVVEVIGPVMALDTCVMILVTPWTIAGLVFPPDDWRPSHLEVGDLLCSTRVNHVDGIGHYLWVPMGSDVFSYPTQESCRAEATKLLGQLTPAVEKARAAFVGVDDLRGLSPRVDG